MIDENELGGTLKGAIVIWLKGLSQNLLWRAVQN